MKKWDEFGKSRKFIEILALFDLSNYLKSNFYFKSYKKCCPQQQKPKNVPSKFESTFKNSIITDKLKHNFFLNFFRLDWLELLQFVGIFD